MPARPPASIDMLQTVMRCSMDIADSASPVYSTTWPAAPPWPILAMIARITSLAATPKGSRWSTRMRIDLGFRCHSVWVTMMW